jgi:DNA-binding NtrC family response regulator
MSGDLVSLRVLVVSASQPIRDLWRQGAALASVPIEFVETDAASAGSALAKGGVDIVLFDAALADAERDGAVAAARANKPAPLIALCGSPAATRPQGIDALLPKPGGIEEARTIVERCVRVRMPIRVLVVDDSGTMRSIVRKILSASRYSLEVSEAEEGITALKQLSGGNADLVLLDYNMPGFNGIETLSEIKRVAPRVAVLMMTSTVDEALAQRAMDSGAVAFIKKPFYPADIDVALDRHFGMMPR